MHQSAAPCGLTGTVPRAPARTVPSAPTRSGN
uniref:Uncharacterized protein n=1 Tax=Arundo donax TaxID=35708 RepID=A0A0A9B5W3_ARUDO